jgi:putative membrane protein
MAGGLTMVLAAMPRVQLHAQLDALRQDSKFILEAASSNIMEVRLGQLAQSKATNPAVKQFGQQMVTDHTNLENQLAATVSKNGSQFKPGMTDDHEDQVERLEKLSGAEFDRAYMTAMLEHHQHDISTFQSQGQSARSTEARQVAASALPVLQRHLATANQVATQIGITTGVAVSNPGTPTQNPPTTTQNPTTQNPPVATQPGQATTQTQADFAADMPFIRTAASSKMMEVRLGQLAQQRGTNSSVKQFAQRMVTDHTQLQNQLTSAATSNGQTFTPTMDTRHQEWVERLESLSGQSFDRAYMNHMIRGHQQDVNQFQTQSQSARSAQVRTLTSNALPLMQQHLSLAVQVGNQVGADSTRTVAGPNQPDEDNDRNRGNVRADAEFIKDVSADNMMQIRLAEMAQNQAKNREVRQFAQRVLQDHTRLQNQWNAMVTRNGLTPREGMGSMHREKVEQLRDAKANNFDRVYMTLMIQQHHDEVTYWRKEGRASRSSQVRNLVDRGLPILEQHFEQAKEIGRKVGVNPNNALRNRKDIARNRNRNRDD